MKQILLLMLTDLTSKTRTDLLLFMVGIKLEFPFNFLNVKHFR